MILAEGENFARVTFEGYSFFVPTDTDENQALVYGRLIRKKLSPKIANHYEEDVGRPPTINSDQFEYMIIATSVFIDN